MIKTLFKHGLGLALFMISSLSFAQTPVLSYSFESGKVQDDSGVFSAQLANDAMIVKTEDGNNVLSTGSFYGYLDLGSNAGKAALMQLTGDYSISVDICVGTDNNLANYCWAWSFFNGTSQYLGLINAAGNGNWYYEIKNSSTSNVKSGTGITTASWHNITIVQSGTTCTYYYDGVVKSSGTITLKPSDLASSITGCYIGKSPFAADAYFKNTLVDNFKVYNSALTLSQVQSLVLARPTSTTVTLGIDNVLQVDRKELFLAQAAGYIHNSLTLPITCTYGTVTWTYTPTTSDGDGALSYTNGTFTVTSRGKKATTVGTLQGTISYSGNTYNLFSAPIAVKVAPDDNAYGYLYCHMPNLVPDAGTGTLVSQCITYALGSKENDGLIYTELNRGSSIINGIGTTLPWCRDAFLAKDTLRKCYYIVTTDLYGSQNSGTSMLGNYSVGMFKSYDLINWTYSRCDIKNYLDKNPVTNIYNDANSALLTSSMVSRVWAPQVIMINGDPYIYYAVGNTDNGDNDHFYISKANSDFTGISSFQMLYGPNRQGNILDADINYLETDSLYHMYYRDYAAGDLRDITTKDLLNPQWSTTPVSTFTDGSGYEAPSVFRRINDDVWSVGNVNYSSNVGYHFHTANACLRNLQTANKLSGHVSPQHGSFIQVTETEYNLVQAWSDIKALITDAKILNARVQSATLASLIAQATTDITTSHSSATDLNALLATLQSDLTALSARYRYENACYNANYANLSDLTANAGKADAAYNGGKLAAAITVAQTVSGSTVSSELITAAQTLELATLSYYKALKSVGSTVPVTNGTFPGTSSGWTGSTPGLASGVAEFFAAKVTGNTVTMTQTLSGLATGYYLVKSQAFERNGDNDYSGRDYTQGVELINYSMTGNTRNAKVQSLYSVPYIGSGSLNGFANDRASVNTLFSVSVDNFANYLLVYVNAGTLTIGLQKPSTSISSISDWCCFDNFEVSYLDGASAVHDVVKDIDLKNALIYSVLGVVVGETNEFANFPASLQDGIYIINGKKVLYNKMFDK